MDTDELSEDELLTIAMLLGFEWTPIDGIDDVRLAHLWRGFGFFNHPHGTLLAVSKITAARAYIQHHMPKKP